jgi:hypothetical protein
MTKASEWAERVDAWRRSGQRAAEFCKDREYTAKSLQWWSSHLRHQGPRPAPRVAGVALARVVRRPPAMQSSLCSPIVVQVGEARVEVASGVDRAALSVVFEALLAATSGARR